MTLGKRIKRARERLRPRLTQKRVAAVFGITEQAVSGWERDEHVPELAKLVKLAKILQVSLAWLLDGAGDPPATDDLQVRIEALSAEERAMLGAMLDALPRHRGRVA